MVCFMEKTELQIKTNAKIHKFSKLKVNYDPRYIHKSAYVQLGEM